ncbi:alpha/beta hydrolase [bacterium]|nr:alpha/beta hydrolase [bacterium]MBU1652436.1 alpha/beta hydrolase [bacterium]MBU1882362.1 alpha/beta hydrolase [bacterium]
MQETLLEMGPEVVSIRHNKISEDRLTLLLVHGLGDSGMTWESVFSQPVAEKYNVIVLDLVGFGRSSKAKVDDGYTFTEHKRRLLECSNFFNVKDLLTIGHSMGGDLVTLLADEDFTGRIKGVVNVEGALTQYDLFLSGKAVQAFNEGWFDDWWESFRSEKAWEWGRAPSGKEYFASLQFCRKEAFLQGAKDIVEWATRLDEPFQSEVGQKFAELKLPKLFCYGTESLPPETLQFIRDNNLPARAFEGIGHCPHYDAAKEFWDHIQKFVTKIEG